MSIGYACLALGVPGTELHKCLLKNADEQRLTSLMEQNLSALENMLDYNIRNGIRLYRISSDVIPFASHPINRVPWTERFGDRLERIGRKARENGMRLSMHPGQYTVLNSPDEQIAQNAVRELEWHARFMDALGLDASHKMVLHIGGVYGDKQAALGRFAVRYQALNEAVRARLVIENDDRLFSAGDVLSLGRRLHIPVVYDNLHQFSNPGDETLSDAEWIAACSKTWKVADGMQKIHYSQSDLHKKRGAHAASIAVDGFMDFYRALGAKRPDIMLEVKDKNISALKCILCTAEPGAIGALEREWGRYKYLVLERSQPLYREMRACLRNKDTYPAMTFFHLAEAALTCDVTLGNAINAAEHVWGYFTKLATPHEKERFQQMLNRYAHGSASLGEIKRNLYGLAAQYRQHYLLESYYFVTLLGAAEKG